MQNGIAPLHKASFKGHKAIVKLLLDNGAMVNQSEEVILNFLESCN